MISNPVNSAGNEFDMVLGAAGRGTTPHQWHNCLIYRVGREGRACAKLGKFYDKGITDIKGTVIIDVNLKNDRNDAFYDGGSFTAWKNKNDPEALYLTDDNLTEDSIMANPGIGATMAGKEVGAVALNASRPYGNVGPDWLKFTSSAIRTKP